MTIDYSNAVLKDEWMFTPFRVPVQGKPLRSQNLPADYELLIIERQGKNGSERRAFSMHEMAYHHVAQGELAGEPYLVSF